MAELFPEESGNCSALRPPDKECRYSKIIEYRVLTTKSRINSILQLPNPNPTICFVLLSCVIVIAYGNFSTTIASKNPPPR